MFSFEIQRRHPGVVLGRLRYLAAAERGGSDRRPLLSDLPGEPLGAASAEGLRGVRPGDLGPRYV